MNLAWCSSLSHWSANTWSTVWLKSMKRSMMDTLCRSESRGIWSGPSVRTWNWSCLMACLTHSAILTSTVRIQRQTKPTSRSSMLKAKGTLGTVSRWMRRISTSSLYSSKPSSMSISAPVSLAPFMMVSMMAPASCSKLGNACATNMSSGLAPMMVGLFLYRFRVRSHSLVTDFPSLTTWTNSQSSL